MTANINSNAISYPKNHSGVMNILPMTTGILDRFYSLWNENSGGMKTVAEVNKVYILVLLKSNILRQS
jgi:hypothetical protein